MNIHRMIRKYFIASELLNSATKSELLSYGRRKKYREHPIFGNTNILKAKRSKTGRAFLLDLKDLYQKRKTAGLPTVFLFKEVNYTIKCNTFKE
jgi:hypothetical protein